MGDIERTAHDLGVYGEAAFWRGMVERALDEIEHLRRGLWDCARAAGADLGDDDRPTLSDDDLVDFALGEVRTLRADYELRL